MISYSPSVKVLLLHRLSTADYRIQSVLCKPNKSFSDPKVLRRLLRELVDDGLVRKWYGKRFHRMCWHYTLTDFGKITARQCKNTLLGCELPNVIIYRRDE